MLTQEIIATREKTLAAHLDGETRKDVESVLATFSGVPVYDLVTVGKVVEGREEVRQFLQTFFDSMGPNTHLAQAFYHSPDATVVEVLTIFPDGFDGEQKGQNLEIRSVGLFPFDGDQLISEKLYADVSPLLPVHALARRGRLVAAAARAPDPRTVTRLVSRDATRRLQVVRVDTNGTPRRVRARAARRVTSTSGAGDGPPRRVAVGRDHGAADVHVGRGRTRPPQGPAGGRVPPLRAARVRPLGRRPHHGPRPRVPAPVLAQPVREELAPPPRLRPAARRPGRPPPRR